MEKSYEELVQENNKLKFELSYARTQFIMISQMITTMFKKVAKTSAESITNVLDDRKIWEDAAERFNRFLEEEMDNIRWEGK